MKISKSLLRIATFAIALVMVLCAQPLLFEADASVYGEFFEFDELKESITSTGTKDLPLVTGFKQNKTDLAMYDKLEVKFDVDATWTNPYDPDDIQVDAVITKPDGTEVTIPAFFMTPMVPDNPQKLNMSYNVGSFDYDPEYNGKSTWAFRYAGDQVGDYSFYITVRDSEGKTSKSTTGTFSCSDAGNKGYVKVSESNPEYFVNSYDNSIYYASGVNIPWVRSDFTLNPLHQSYNYFIGKANGTTNMTRIWICHYNWLEWSPEGNNSNTWGYIGLGYYNQLMGCSFDNILEECEKAGLRVILCTEDNDEQFPDGSYGNWAYNPYSVEQGGPAKNTTDYWTNPEVRKQYKKRLRYILARWGYSPALFSINMWNDMQDPTAATVSYLTELGEYTHSITDGWRPIIFGSNFNREANAALDMTVQLINIGMEDRTKPYLTQECYASYDDLRNTLRNSVWTEFVQGAAGTLYWSQDEVDLYDNGKGCWDVFSNILDFSSDIPLDKSGVFNYSTIAISGSEVVTPSEKYQTVTSVRSYGDVSGWAEPVTYDTYEIDTTVAGMNLVGYHNKYYGTKWNGDCRVPVNFKVETPNGGKVILGVTEVSNGTLQVSVNGKVVKTQGYEAGRHVVADDEEGRYVEVELAPGSNTVTIDNVGADWVAVGELYFVCNGDSAESLLAANAMVSDSAAVAYVKNLTYDRTSTILLGNTPTDFKNVKFTIEGLKEDGRYAMYTFDPDTGAYTSCTEVTVAGGKVEVTIPEIKLDAAVKVYKLADGETVGTGSRYGYTKLTSETVINNPNASNGGTNQGTQNGDAANGEGGSSATIIIIIVAAVAVIGGAAFVVISKKKKEAEIAAKEAARREANRANKDEE